MRLAGGVFETEHSHPRRQRRSRTKAPTNYRAAGAAMKRAVIYRAAVDEG